MKTSPQILNNQDQILLAANQLPAPFTLEQLIVAAWREFPQAFGLKGFQEHYPDSNKVICYLAGVKGLVWRQLLNKHTEKTYSIAPRGVNRIQEILHPGERIVRAEKPKILTPVHQDFLLRTIDSACFHKFNQNIGKETTFSEACLFWDMDGQRIFGEDVDKHLTIFSGIVDGLILLLMGTRELEMSCGMVVDLAMVKKIGDCHAFMLIWFTKHLKLLRNREIKESDRETV